MPLPQARIEQWDVVLILSQASVTSVRATHGVRYHIVPFGPLEENVENEL